MGPCCFLLCLIQLFKAQSLHVKLHAFSPFFSLLRSLPHLYVFALSAYSNASLVCVSGSSAWPSCQNSPPSKFSPGCYLSNTSNTNTRLTNIPCKMFSLPLYMQYVNNEREYIIPKENVLYISVIFWMCILCAFECVCMYVCVWLSVSSIVLYTK